MAMNLAQNDIQPHKGKSWSRQDGAEMLEALAAAQREGHSERSFSKASGVPRTTLQYWRTRRAHIEAAPRVVAFFESPEGVVFLERLTLAAHFVMTLMGHCGIRLVSTFLEHAGLDRFIGCSYGAQHQVSSEVLDLVTTYGEEEQARLAKSMPHKKITLCLDETFPARGQCLVAMEPVSGFLLLEAYREKRDADTWNCAIESATKELDVIVEQVTSDEAKALIRHAKDQNAHHSPDLFHVQQEITRALGRSMALPVRTANEALIDSVSNLESQEDAKRAYEQGPRRSGRPPAFDKRIRNADDKVTRHRAALETARAQQARYTTALHGVSDEYHPYVLETGAPRTSEALADELQARFSKLDELATGVRLSDKLVKKLKKAQRVVPKMVATLAFYHQQVHARVQAQELPQGLETLLIETWIPAAYLLGAASKARTIVRREQLWERAMTIMDAHKAHWQGLTLEEQKRLDVLARECAEIFQRSSSCVEGRNGRLALAEHASRQLPEKKLRGLTVMHNYATRRLTDTTPAERFFEAAPLDLFDWLQTRFSDVPRPAQRRSQAKNGIPLLCQQ